MSCSCRQSNVLGGKSNNNKKIEGLVDQVPSVYVKNILYYFFDRSANIDKYLGLKCKTKNDFTIRVGCGFFHMEDFRSGEV